MGGDERIAIRGGDQVDRLSNDASTDLECGCSPGDCVLKIIHKVKLAVRFPLSGSANREIRNPTSCKCIQRND